MDDDLEGAVAPVGSRTGFKDAFADARKSGAKTFMYRGNKYTTELASDKKTATPKMESKTSTEDFNKVTPEEKSRRQKMEQSEALEGVYPEQMIGPSGGVMGIRMLANAARGMARRDMARAAEKGAKEMVTERLAAPAKQITGPSKAELMARDRAARAASRNEEMLNENASRYGLDPNAPGYGATAGALRENIGGKDFTVKKKGGTVKMAKGGMTASSRGDGIAQRGKTRGKYC
jgi:hypothetical protein